jgi:putative transposase
MERAREAGLFRYSLVQELLEPGLSQAERGWRARELAGRAHQGPGGRRVTVSYATLTRWRRLYESGGFDALVPSPRQPAPRTPDEVLALAEALKREKPGRTAAQVRRILQVASGWAPSERTLQRLFERLELNRPAPGPEEEQRAFGRFECTRPNEMWTGDTLHGPVIGGAKSYLSVTWNHDGVSPCDRRDQAVASPQADGDGGPAGDGCGVVRQMAGSKAAWAGCRVARDLG